MFNITAGSNHSTGLAGLGVSVSNSAPSLPAGAHTPARRLTDWTTALDAAAMSDPSKARALLEGIAQGRAQPDEAAQWVFSDLIAHDAHALFVEVFTAHNELLQTQAEGKDFQSRLMLQLPSGWKTSAPAAMEQAFSRVRVDLLAVMRAPGSTEPASEAVCTAIAAMLKFGTSALWLQGALEEPLLVANAIATSVHLQVIALEDPQLGRPLDAREVNSHYILIARGLVRSTSLRRIGLHRPELVTSLQLCLLGERKPPKAWTELKLNFSGADEAVTRPFVARLDEFLENFPDLDALEIRPEELDLYVQAAGAGTTTTTTATTFTATTTTTDPGGT